MQSERKVTISRFLICYSYSISVAYAVYEALIAPVYPILYQPGKLYELEVTFHILLAISLILGIYIGIKNVKKPLSLKKIFYVLFGFPCWIPLVLYAVVFFISAIIWVS